MLVTHNDVDSLTTLLGLPARFDRGFLVARMRMLDATLCVHAEYVADISAAIGHAVGLSEQDRTTLESAAWLHDLGKLAISPAILQKPGPLDESEWVAMRAHSQSGAEYLRSIHAPHGVTELVLHHHERFSGGGYPLGIRGNDIPLGSRILCVADAYDAMTTERPYRHALSSDAALDEVQRCSGSQFDPEVVVAFVSVFSTTMKGKTS